MFVELPSSKHNKVVNFLYCDKTIHIPLFDAENIPLFTALLCHIRVIYNVEKPISIKTKQNKTKHQVLVQCGLHWNLC